MALATGIFGANLTTSALHQMAARRWTDLAFDFAGTIRGASARHHHVRDLNQPFNDSRDDLPDADPSDTTDTFVELRYNRRQYAKVHPVGIGYLWSEVQFTLDDRYRLIHHGKNCEILRLPTPDFMEAALCAVFGEGAVQWRYADGEVPREEIFDDGRDGKRVLGLSMTPLWLGDINKMVHGLIFAVHEINHGAYFAKNRKVRQKALELAYAIQQLPERPRQRLDHALNQISDMDFGQPTLEGVATYVFGKLALDFRMQREKLPTEKRDGIHSSQKRWIERLLGFFEGNLSPDLYRSVHDYFRSQYLVKVA